MSGRKRSLLTDMFRHVKRPRVAPAVGQANGLIDGKEGNFSLHILETVIAAAASIGILFSVSP